MKKNVFVLGLLAIGIAVSSFTLMNNNTKVVKEENMKASIKWENTTQNAGQVEQGKPVTLTFEFTNNGNVPLTISNVKPSCGCTVASFPKEPILPGQTEKIKSTYNAAKKGAFKKSITVTSNADPAVQVLYITGEVI